MKRGKEASQRERSSEVRRKAAQITRYPSQITQITQVSLTSSFRGGERGGTMSDPFP